MQVLNQSLFSNVQQNMSFLWSVIIVKGSLEFTLLPYSFYYLVIYFQLSCPVLQPFQPSTSKYFAIGKEKGTSAVFQSLLVLSFIPVSIGPSKYSISSKKSLKPFSFVCTPICIAKCPLTIKITLRKLSFIYSRLANIMPVPLFDSSLEISFVVRPISKFLLPFPVRLIFLPQARILIVLEGIKISTFTMRLAVLNLTFVNTSIIKYIATLYCCLPVGKATLVIRTFFEVKLSLTMKSFIQPISSIIPFRPQRLFVGIREQSLGYQTIIFYYILRQLLHLLSHNWRQQLYCYFFRYRIFRPSLIGLIFSVSFELFFCAAFILAHAIGIDQSAVKLQLLKPLILGNYQRYQKQNKQIELNNRCED